MTMLLQNHSLPLWKGSWT